MLSLYLKKNEKFWENDEVFDSIKKLLPVKLSNLGRPPSIATKELEKKYEWPPAIDVLSKTTKSKMLGLAMEHVIVFFFNHFCYTFAGENFKQSSGGP